MAVQPIIRISAFDYYQLPEYAAHDLIQLIEGEVVIAVPPIPKHQSAVAETLFLLMTCSRTLGGKAYSAPIEVYLDEFNIYQPDVLYIAPQSRCIVEEKRLVGPPDLVVEVLSPSTAKLDREKKFRAYQKHGVREYWIIDPVNAYLEVWVLQNEIFTKLGTFTPDDTFESPVLNQYQVTLSAIFAA
ncbi:MAG: Uma2 family endonuclease [Anaerolineae bacterium]|nr:Uma2 family endonuclease [Anaerolineae bacterium]